MLISMVECLQIDEHSDKFGHISGSLIPIGTCRRRSGGDPKQGCLCPIWSATAPQATHGDAQSPPQGGPPNAPERRECVPQRQAASAT